MLIHWIVIYPVDSAIQLLNNWGLVKGQNFLVVPLISVYKEGVTLSLLLKCNCAFYVISCHTFYYGSYTCSDWPNTMLYQCLRHTSRKVRVKLQLTQ